MAVKDESHVSHITSSPSLALSLTCFFHSKSFLDYFLRNSNLLTNFLILIIILFSYSRSSRAKVRFDYNRSVFFSMLSNKSSFCQTLSFGEKDLILMRAFVLFQTNLHGHSLV